MRRLGRIAAQGNFARILVVYLSTTMLSNSRDYTVPLALAGDVCICAQHCATSHTLKYGMLLPKHHVCHTQMCHNHRLGLYRTSVVVVLRLAFGKSGGYGIPPSRRGEGVWRPSPRRLSKDYDLKAYFNTIRNY